MKTKTFFYFALIFVTIFSCKSKDNDNEFVTQSASLSIMLGYWGNSLGFIPFVNQKTNKADSVASNDLLVLYITKKKSPCRVI
jgi:hypothetical protein